MPNPRKQPELLVFTDLDGSLLDPEDYTWSGAESSLARLRDLDVPIVFVTSKTRSEVEELRHQMELDEPFVVENGGGIFFPERYAEAAPEKAVRFGPFLGVTLGRTYREIREFVSELPAEMGFRGFGDMSAREIADVADLPLEDAVRAKRREFTEPFLLTGEEGALERLTRRARERDFAIVRGGRFHHLIGPAQDKGRAVRIVAEALAGIHRGPGEETVPPTTIGLGDSPNDLPMLREVDLAVVIPDREGRVLVLDRPTITAPSPGSVGWNVAMTRILELYESPTPRGPSSR